MNNRGISCELENHAAQLASLLTLLHGVGHESFEALYPRDRDNILWIASDLADAINDEINGTRGTS